MTHLQRARLNKSTEHPITDNLDIIKDSATVEFGGNIFTFDTHVSGQTNDLREQSIAAGCCEPQDNLKRVVVFTRSRVLIKSEENIKWLRQYLGTIGSASSEAAEICIYEIDIWKCKKTIEHYTELTEGKLKLS